MLNYMFCCGMYNRHGIKSIRVQHSQKGFTVRCHDLHASSFQFQSVFALTYLFPGPLSHLCYVPHLLSCHVFP